ncbi:MAG: ExbD/TolR family protein, partial [Acidobacteriota bacterium]|nr:ExbD/TolR family protein [Acidobacteriota bacterium]
TPFIDVMLVLLIIFMVAAPMLTTGVDVNLPEAKTGKSLESEALTVTMSEDGRIQFGKTFVQLGVLQKLLREQARLDRKRPVMVRADHNLPYGRVIAVVDSIREAGFSQVGFVTQASLEAEGQ